jgi:hypothetical protein
MTIVADLIAGIIDLLFRLIKGLPGFCYFTGITVVYAATLGRVTVEYPRRPDIEYHSWRKSPEGRTLLSPTLGIVFGFSFWALVIALSVTVYEYSHSRETNLHRRSTLFCVLHALNQPCASPLKEK